MAGFVGGRVNTVIMRTVDVFYAFPSVLLAVAISGALGAGVTNALLALTIVGNEGGGIVVAAGTSLGFPMAALSMSDDPVLAAARVNMIITIVYISSITVGPALGGVGQAFGLFVAFAIPVVLLIVSAMISKVTKPSQVY